MATSLTVTVSCQTQYDYAEANTGFSSSKQSSTPRFSPPTYQNSQADTPYGAVVTIPAASNQVWTLSAIPGSDPGSFFGNLLTFARVKSIQVELLTTTSAASILIGGSGNAWATWCGAPSHQVRVRNGGAFFLGTLDADATSYLVTVGTGDKLQISNEDGANAATVRLTITGLST